MKWIEYNWLKLVAVLMLAAALMPVPYYAYYQLMNWVVVGAALMSALQAQHNGKNWTAWLFILVAVVFNPVDSLHLRADVWQVADIIAASLLVCALFIARPQISAK